jgi:hypothetical protein
MAVVTEPDTSGHLETGVMTWIRLSTGQLCIEVTDGNERDHTELNWSPPDPSPSLAINLMSGTGPTLDQNLMSTMTLNGIHLILCYLVFHRRLAVFQNLRATHCSSGFTFLGKTLRLVFPSICRKCFIESSEVFGCECNRLDGIWFLI